MFVLKKFTFVPMFVGFTLLTCSIVKLPARAADAGTETAQDAHTSISLEALSRLKGIELDSNPAVKAVVLKILDQVRGTPQFVEIVRDFNIRGQTDGLIQAAEKDPAGPT